MWFPISNRCMFFRLQKLEFRLFSLSNSQNPVRSKKQGFRRFIISWLFFLSIWHHTFEHCFLIILFSLFFFFVLYFLSVTSLIRAAGCLISSCFYFSKFNQACFKHESAWFFTQQICWNWGNIHIDSLINLKILILELRYRVSLIDAES